MSEEVEKLKAEVAHLQSKLGELHGSDLTAVRRAYRTLCQHVAALEEESAGMVAGLEEIETQAVPPELVAKELGVAAAVAFGLAVLRQTIKVLPLKQSPVLAKGMWLLGGAFVLARLTGGTLAHMTAMFHRNASRKRRLLQKLATVQERIEIMAALQQWTERQPPPGTAARGGSVALEAGESAATATAGADAGAGVRSVAAAEPAHRVSPATSSGSSAELVEMPQAEELEAAEAGAAGGPARMAVRQARTDRGERGGSAPPGGHQAQGGRSTGSGDAHLATLMAYVELGKK